MEVFLVPQMGREVNPLRDLQAIFALAALMRRQDFSLVHTHNSKAGFLGRKAARLAHIPTVIHTVHGFAFHDQESIWRRSLYRHLERMASRWCDGMIFISQPLIEWARRERIGLGVPQTLIYSGIDAEAFRSADGRRFREKFGISSDRLVVGIISKLWEGKGHEILLRSWKAVLNSGRITSPPLLMIVGEGHLESHLRVLVAQMELESSVLFTGFQADIPGATAALDISVLPSLFEGMGRVVLEAMAAGKPIIASRVGGIPDLVQDGRSGILVPPADPEKLRDALLALLTQPEFRQSLAAGSSTALRPEHTAAHMVEEIHRFYTFLINGYL
jgi:glycosyltransferase involved in cell wall biosynthesis